jgi:hypothetical protein
MPPGSVLARFPARGQRWTLIPPRAETAATPPLGEPAQLSPASGFWITLSRREAAVYLPSFEIARPDFEKNLTPAFVLQKFHADLKSGVGEHPFTGRRKFFFVAYTCGRCRANQVRGSFAFVTAWICEEMQP